MTPTTEQAAIEWLHTEAQACLHETMPPQAIDIRRDHTALIATLQFAETTKRLVIKACPNNHAFSGPKQFYETHQVLRGRSTTLEATTPEFLALDSQLLFFVMEHVPGEPLETWLTRQRWWHRPNNTDTQPAARTGEALAALHRIKATEVGLKATPRKNASYISSLENSWHTTGHLPHKYRDSACLVGRQSSSFRERTGEYVNIVDSQPKNVLVRDSGDICLIDPNYGCINPAIGIGYFLSSIDRIGLGSLTTRRHLRCWQRAFLDGYFANAAPAITEDLPFFYIWTLLQTQKRHINTRPRWHRYLRWAYGQILTEFMRNLDSLSLPEIIERPSRLFAEP